jgi:hypothetical protein
MTFLRFGLSVCVAGFLAAGCPADDGEDDANDDMSMTSTPGSETGMDSTGEPGDTSGGTPSDLSHAADIQPIWDAHCVDACHEPDGEWGFLLDMSVDAYDDIVGVMAPQLASMNHIEPGDPDSSYIWHKINNTQAGEGGSGLQMPKAPTGGTATVLTQAEMDMIEAWITAGAPE